MRKTILTAFFLCLTSLFANNENPDFKKEFLEYCRVHYTFERADGSYSKSYGNIPCNKTKDYRDRARREYLESLSYNAAPVLTDLEKDLLAAYLEHLNN